MVSVAFGLAAMTQVAVPHHVPRSAVVGPDASAEQIDEHAVDVDPGQFLYEVEQLSDEFPTVAVRKIGQVDVDADGVPRLVRFRIVCCAVDAIRLWVKLDEAVDMEPGTWVSVTGQWDGDSAWHSSGILIEIDGPENPYLST